MLDEGKGNIKEVMEKGFISMCYGLLTSSEKTVVAFLPCLFFVCVCARLRVCAYVCVNC